MNDQNQNPSPNPDPSAPAPGPVDWREQRREERRTRHADRMQRHGGHHSAWIGGAILILVGVFLLLQNMGLPFVGNWWALFILIPAFWAYDAAWNIYRANGRLTRGGASSLTTGILLTVLALVFLFNVALGPYWPVLLIIGGLLLLGTAFLPT